MINSNKLSFTVFTPVFNSAKTIHRVWESLNSQCYKNFEWIIVDDGSDDSIGIIINKYISSSNFKITFLSQENQGKHIAWNKAIKIASGDLFVPADSDDRFDADTLSFFYKKWLGINELDRKNYSGINVLCRDNISKRIIGDKYPKEKFKSNLLDLTYKFKIKGEKWGCVRLDLLKKYPYPEIIGRGSYILNYAWFSLSKNYSILCYNKPLRLYYTDSESITHQKNFVKKRIKESETRVHYIKWHLKNHTFYLIKNDISSLIKLIFSYVNFWLYTKNKSKYKFIDIDPIYIRLLILLAFVPILCYHHCEKRFK